MPWMRVKSKGVFIARARGSATLVIRVNLTSNHWIHYHRTALNPRARVIWHVLNVWGRRWRAGASMGRSADLPMAAGPHHFLLEGVPTCHGVCWPLCHVGCFAVGPWIRVTSSSTLERRLKCDPRVGNGSGILHMDPTTLAWPGGSIGRSGDLHMEAPPAHLPPFVISCIKIPQGTSGTCYW